MTRDLLAVQMSVIRDRASFGLSLLGELAQPAFKPWDIEVHKETVESDYEQMSPYDILMERVHEVIPVNLDYAVVFERCLLLFCL